MIVRELFDLAGRTALVTGAGGHLGRIFARTLLEQGAYVIMMDLHETVHEAAKQIDPSTKRVMALQVDLEQEDDLRSVFSEALGWRKSLDILVNNAAFVGTSTLSGWSVPFESQESTAFRRALEVNLTAVFTLCQLARPHLSRSGKGAIVNIASIYGLVGPDNRLYESTGMGNPIAYGASKAGILQITRYLATTLAPDIRINAITPGGIERGQPSAFQKRYRERTPMRRMAKEEDFCGALAYLASDASAYVTGQNLIVDGGWSSW